MSAKRPLRRSATTRPGRRSVLLLQAWWEDRVLRGVAAYAAAHDWELQCRMRWTHQLPAPGDWRGDGIIAFVGVSSHMRRVSQPLVDFVRAASVPVVQTQQLEDSLAAPRVIVPHEQIGRLAADHFLELKFEHIGYVTFDENPVEEHRREAFRRTIAAAGRTFHALTPGRLARELARLPRPLGLLAVNDANALEVIAICRDAGCAIPEEIAVMGIDDSEIVCDFASVPLTSINCNYEQQGYEAAALLDRLMDGAAPPAAPVIIHPRGVTVRRSTDTVAIPDLATAKVLRCLRDRYREPLTVQQIVEELGIPRRRVSDSFRACVGRTMSEELARLRVQRANELLADRRLKLEWIARECGFSNRFHLTTTFRRLLGQTPRARRRELARNSAADEVGHHIVRDVRE